MEVRSAACLQQILVKVGACPSSAVILGLEHFGTPSDFLGNGQLTLEEENTWKIPGDPVLASPNIIPIPSMELVYLPIHENHKKGKYAGPMDPMG